jgi:ribonuclease HII
MQWVIGIDEVGRGPLAGPVAVGAALLPLELNDWKHWDGLKDSKKLTEKKREEWYQRIKEDTRITWGVSSSGARIINLRGIVAATREAAVRALESVGSSPNEAHVVLDRGLSVPDIWKQEQFTKGDETIPAIAIASIMAKVTRDRYMVGLGEKYPGYGFEAHKGYGTKFHQDAIRANGAIRDIHRTLFIRSLT